eukprot:g9419.t1
MDDDTETPEVEVPKSAEMATGAVNQILTLEPLLSNEAEPPPGLGGNRPAPLELNVPEVCDSVADRFLGLHGMDLFDLLGVVKDCVNFKQRMAELDDKLEPGQQLVLWRLDPRPEMWKQLPFHPHGCRLLAVGPGNELVASASKERLVLSHRSGPGAPLEASLRPERVW